MGDSDSSARQQCVYGVGENWNAGYCSFSVSLWCAVTRRRRSGGKNPSAVEHAESSLHTDEMINVEPSRPSLRSPPPLCLLFSRRMVFSTATCLQILQQQSWRSVSLYVVVVLLFVVVPSFLIPVTSPRWLPSCLPLLACRRRTWSGSLAWEPCLWWAARETASRTRCAPCRRSWRARSLW